MIKSKLITNPYFIYTISFIIVLLCYQLNWSSLYPELSWQLVTFIVITMVVATFIGLYFHAKNYFTYNPIKYGTKKLFIYTTFIVIGYILEFIYVRAIPLYAIITGADYDYRTFGIPTFHVFLVNFNSFVAVLIFHDILSQRNKIHYLYFVICLLPPILIFNRGMFLLILASCAFLYLMSTRRPFKLLIKLSTVFMLILFLFGIAGNVRTGGDTANNVILQIGEAKQEFIESAVPHEFFWAYLYISSPLANVQETIDFHEIPPFSLKNLLTFINDEMLPDFISKRNFSLLQLQKEHIDQIAPFLTVGTFYGGSFAYLGWAGMSIMFFYMIIFNIFILLIVKKNSVYFNSSLAILNCIVLFNIFDNMYRFSGLVLQLVFPLLLNIRVFAQK